MTRSQAAALRADPIDRTCSGWSSDAAADAVGVVRVPRWIAALARWVDPDSYRFALGAVLIESDGFNATAVALDGRRIAVVHVPQGDSMAVLRPIESSFLVPADQLAKAIKQVPPRWRPGTRSAESNGDGSEYFVTIEGTGDGTVRVSAADGWGSSVVIPVCCNGRFPDWRSAVDANAAEDQSTGTLHCNPAMLADVAFLAQAANAHSVTVRFTSRPALVGHFETVDGCKGRVVVVGFGAADPCEWVEFERERIAAVRHHATRKRCGTRTNSGHAVSGAAG